MFFWGCRKANIALAVASVFLALIVAEQSVAASSNEILKPCKTGKRNTTVNCFVLFDAEDEGFSQQDDEVAAARFVNENGGNKDYLDEFVAAYRRGFLVLDDPFSIAGHPADWHVRVKVYGGYGLIGQDDKDVGVFLSPRTDRVMTMQWRY